MDFYFIKHAHSWEKDKCNIAHFFHEYLFYAIQSYLINNDIIFVLDTKLSEWELQFTLLVSKHFNINVEYSDTLTYIPFADTLTYIPFAYNRNIILQDSPYYRQILQIIKDIVRKEYNIENSTTYKILYFRNDCIRRRMLNYNNELNELFDKVIMDMSILSFEEQVKLFMGCSHLVTIDGAHLTNILFMNENAKVYDIITDNIDRCWTLKFGLYNCINNGNFNIYVIPNTDFNDNITYNKDIENNIKNFLDGSNIMKLTDYLIKSGVNINPTQIEGYTQQVPDQVTDLINIIQSVNKPTVNAMEIGFNAGHSAEIFLENTTVNLTSFDNMYWHYTPIAKIYIDNTYPNRHTMVCGDSTVTIPEYSKTHDTKFDIIFIDGNHEYTYAYNDLKNCAKLAHKDTIVIIDDTMYEEKWKDTWTVGPTKAWTEHIECNQIIELNRKDYLHGRGMSWGRYNI